MCPDPVCTRTRGEELGGEGRRADRIEAAARELAQKRFTRDRHEHGPPETRTQHRDPLKHRDRSARILPEKEAHPWIHDQPLLADPPAHERREPRVEEALDRIEDLLRARECAVSAFGLGKRVDDDEIGGPCGELGVERLVGEAPDIVQPVRSGGEGEAQDLGMGRVDAAAQVGGAQGFENRAKSRDLPIGGDLGGVGMARGGAELDDVGTGRRELPGMGDRALGREIAAAVRERVLGDVDDADDLDCPSHTAFLARDVVARRETSPMQSTHASASFGELHESTFRNRAAAPGARLPAEYASTLVPFSITLAESGEAYTYAVRDGRIELSPGADRAATQVELSQASFEGLTRDLESSAGLIYGVRARALRGDLMDFMQWEPALRWLYTGRPVHDPSAVDLRGLRGEPLDPAHAFRLGDDREEMAHYLRTVGYVFVRDVLSREEIETLRAESENLRRLAQEGDQESWWGKRSDGSSVLCRVLRAGTQPTMRSLHGDPRLWQLAELCDEPMHLPIAAEDKDGVTLLWKQPGVEEGLGDLPWHRDCGLGGHASMCPTAVVSVFLGPNTPEAGELRFLPGSWRSSFPHQTADSAKAPQGVAPPARSGDVTIHYGDGLHVAPSPTRTTGPFRSCILLGFARKGGGHHEGGRHYNDVLLGDESGQIPDIAKAAARR